MGKAMSLYCGVNKLYQLKITWLNKTENVVQLYKCNGHSLNFMYSILYYADCRVNLPSQAG